MKGDKIVRFFMPKEERFHELLERDTQQLLNTARLFLDVARTTGVAERRPKIAALTAAEKEADKLTAEIFAALNSTFITPLDREDIRMIASDLDDIVDYLEQAGQYLMLFEIKDSPAPLQKFAEILVAMVEEIHAATSLIWDMGNEKKIHENIVRISKLENEADALYFEVIAELFREGSGRSPVEILKWKEVYQGLEDACDACKEYTHVMGNVIVKNA
jgi:predicted phosphate transport protein (TIGR00153 family)